VKVLRHARILRSAPPGRKAAGVVVVFAVASLVGCLGDPRTAANADVSESDIVAIEAGEAACLPVSGSGCAPTDPGAPCDRVVDWKLQLIVDRSGCDVPGVDADEVGLPVQDKALPQRPAFSLGTVDPGPDLLVDARTLSAEVEGVVPDAADPTLVFRAALGSFNPDRCAWPFELGWYRDTAAGVRQIVRLHGLLASDGTASGTGERRDESVHFACSSDLRIVRVPASP
jgi:hypothetical protein